MDRQGVNRPAHASSWGDDDRRRGMVYEGGPRVSAPIGRRDGQECASSATTNCHAAGLRLHLMPPLVAADLFSIASRSARRLTLRKSFRIIGKSPNSKRISVKSALPGDARHS
jgi:hypothetical protein